MIKSMVFGLIICSVLFVFSGCGDDRTIYYGDRHPRMIMPPPHRPMPPVRPHFDRPPLPRH